MNRGRIQAQGSGTEKSTTWATIDSFTKGMGINKANDLQAILTAPELRLRNNAIQQARNRILTAPAYGIDAVMKKSYYDDFRNRHIRIDIEVNCGTSFVDNPVDEDDNE